MIQIKGCYFLVIRSEWDFLNMIKLARTLTEESKEKWNSIWKANFHLGLRFSVQKLDGER